MVALGTPYMGAGKGSSLGTPYMGTGKGSSLGSLHELKNSGEKSNATIILFQIFIQAFFMTELNKVQNKLSTY